MMENLIIWRKVNLDPLIFQIQYKQTNKNKTNKRNVRISNFLNKECFAYKQTKQASAMLVYAFLVDPSLLHKQII